MNLPNPVAIATPVFVLLILIELMAARFGARRNTGSRARFEPSDSLASLTMGLGSSFAGALTGGAVVELRA